MSLWRWVGELALTYLGIDVERARELAFVFESTSRAVAPIRELIAEAETLAQLPVRVALRLDDISSDFVLLSRSVQRASVEADRFRLPLPLKKATVLTQWNRTFQQASHNSYEIPGGIQRLYEEGIRTYELDLHLGAPTSFDPGSSWLPYPLALLADHLDDHGGRVGDWRVYHHSGSSESAYRYLSDGLRVIAELDSTEPVTLFIDLKDPLGGGHDAAALDRLLRGHLGERLFSPADLLAGVAPTTSLAHVVAADGWPSVGELRGKVIVVLTDHVDGYDLVGPAAFIARQPRFERLPTGELRHVAEENVVFYNAVESSLSAEAISAVQHGGNLVRTYGGPAFLPPELTAHANYRAVDHRFDLDPDAP